MVVNVSRLWCVVPAAGIGTRMGADRPKQYLSLGGRSVIEITLERMSRLPGLGGIVVGVAEHDAFWENQDMPDGVPVQRSAGGAERAHTVRNGLETLRSVFGADDSDAVLVHDAVRPCFNLDDVNRLVKQCQGESDGGLLGCPLADTLKRVGDENTVIDTVPRRHLWRALTPQLFSLGALASALDAAIEGGEIVTDEAEAMERTGASPRILDSDPRNIKITRLGDLEIATAFVGMQDVG